MLHLSFLQIYSIFFVMIMGVGGIAWLFNALSPNPDRNLRTRATQVGLFLTIGLGILMWYARSQESYGVVLEIVYVTAALSTSLVFGNLVSEVLRRVADWEI